MFERKKEELKNFKESAKKFEKETKVCLIAAATLATLTIGYIVGASTATRMYCSVSRNIHAL